MRIHKRTHILTPDSRIHHLHVSQIYDILFSLVLKQLRNQRLTAIEYLKLALRLQIYFNGNLLF